MGIFFEKQPLVVPTFRNELRTAFNTQPPAAAQIDALVNASVQRVTTGPAKTLNVWNLIGSFVLLLLIFLAGIWTARDPQLKAFSDALLHSFTVLLGIIVGLVSGENAS